MPLDSYDPTAVSVFDVTTVLPNLICVEIRDPEIIDGTIIGPIETPETGSYTTAIQRTNPNSGNTEWCFPRGASKNFLQFLDIRATEYLDRAAVSVAGDWTVSGGLTVSAVYQWNEPYDNGYCKGVSITTANCLSFRHHVFLALSGAIVSGTSYTITPPAGTGLAAFIFDFDDRVTRCYAFRNNQVGFRPDDITKEAQLGAWVPGAPNEGAIQFSETDFEIINIHGAVQYAGQIVPRVGPTDIEENANYGVGQGDPALHGYLEGLIRHYSTSNPPLQGVAVTIGNPGVIEYDPDGPWTPANGEYVGLSGWQGVGFGADYHKISNLNTVAHTFEIDHAATGTHVPGHFLPGYDSLIHRTHLANRAATYVYNLDFSAWMDGVPGYYRIRIPGLGVGDTFTIDPAIWREIVAKTSMYGLHSHRLGCAIDLPTYQRPSCFRDGEIGPDGNEVIIYKSTLPAAFATEPHMVGIVGSDLGAIAPWITAERATGWYGGTMDAGDWDTFIYAHIRGFYYLITLGYEYLPEAARATNWGIPKSTVTLDPTTYAGTDDLPDIVHEFYYFMDGFRRLQRVDGAVGGGVGYSTGGLIANSAGAGPTWLPGTGSAYIHAPDHCSNFAYAIGAAKAAIISAGAGLTTLAALWLQSAEDAFAWAEAIYQNAAGERDAYYITELDIKTKASLDDTEYGQKLTDLDTLCDVPRSAAAATIFRATGNTDYKDIAEENGGNGQGFSPICFWEYIHAEGADPTVAASYSLQFGLTGAFQVTYVVPYSQGDISYRNQGYKDVITLTPSPSQYENAVMSHLTTGSDDWLDTILAHESYVLGANQYGHCQTVGVGARDFRKSILHQDTIRSGQDAFAGITIYGVDPGFPGTFLSFADDNPANGIAQYATGLYEADFGTTRIYQPHFLSIPRQQKIFPHRFIVSNMEYTFHQTMVPQIVYGMALHARGDNTAQALSPRRIRLRSQPLAA